MCILFIKFIIEIRFCHQWNQEIIYTAHRIIRQIDTGIAQRFTSIRMEEYIFQEADTSAFMQQLRKRRGIIKREVLTETTYHQNAQRWDT